jgi:hypothetical protein
MQLVRNKEHPMFLGANKAGDDRVVNQTQQMWADYLGLKDNFELAGQFHGLLRDIFYTRITWDNFTVEYLRTLAEEFKNVVLRTAIENGGTLTKVKEIDPQRRRQV